MVHRCSRSSFQLGLVEILRKSEWVPAPLGHSGEIFAEISPADIAGILMSMWDFIRDFLPTAEAYQEVEEAVESMEIGSEKTVRVISFIQ